MAQDTALQKRIQRIGEIVEQLECAADPNARAMAKELLEALMALHGAALERILDLASKLGEAGETLLQKCGSDELVSSVLLLYGLHPEGLHSRVAYALEKSRTFLASHGARAELLSCGEDGIRVRLHLKANGCGSSGATVKSTLEAALQDAAPDAAAILVEEAASAAGSGFVPVGQLSGNMAAALSGSRTPGSGD